MCTSTPTTPAPRPFTSLLEGVSAVEEINALGESGRVVLAAGDYRDELEIHKVTIEIVGRCAAMVTLTGDVETIGWPDHFVTIRVTGPGGLILRDVTIQSNQVGLLVQDNTAGVPAALFAERVVLRGAVGGGVFAEGEGTLAQFHQCHVTGARKLPPGFAFGGPDDSSTGHEFGFGVQVRYGAELVMERSLVEQSASIGLFIEDPGTTATVRDTVISRGGYYGAQVKETAAAHFERSAILDATGAGVMAVDPNTAVTMADSVVRRVIPREVAEDEHFAMGVGMADGSLTMDRCVVADVPGPALYIYHPGSQADLRDVLITRLPTSDGILPPTGITAFDGATVTIERMSVLDHEGCALRIYSAQCDARYLYVAMGHQVDPTVRGAGAIIAYDADVTVAQSVLADSEGTGVTVYGGGHLTMSGSRLARWSAPADEAARQELQRASADALGAVAGGALDARASGGRERSERGAAAVRAARRLHRGRAALRERRVRHLGGRGGRDGPAAAAAARGRVRVAARLVAAARGADGRRRRRLPWHRASPTGRSLSRRRRAAQSTR